MFSILCVSVRFVLCLMKLNWMLFKHCPVVLLTLPFFIIALQDCNVFAQ